MKDKIHNLLEEISDFDEQKDSDERKEEIAEDIINFYDKNKRHHYSGISSYVLYKLDEQNTEYLIGNLLLFVNYFKEKGMNEYAEKLEKMYDHVVLETIRKKHNEKQLEIVKNYADESKKELQDLFKEQEEKIKMVYGDIISILGIFSAVIIAFFGGINILGSALSNMDKVSKYRLIFVILAIGFVTFNIIFMLLYTISKLIEKPIRSECKNNICEECKEKDKFIKMRCFRKYPVAYLFNLISIGMMILIIIAYYKKL